MENLIVQNYNILARLTATTSVGILTRLDTDGIVARIEHAVNDERILTRLEVESIAIL
jgi:hypothetical protein